MFLAPHVVDDRCLQSFGELASPRHARLRGRCAEQRDALGLVQEIGEPVERLGETEVGRGIDALPVMPKSRNKPKQPSLF
jgi:hypothetical protein